MGYYNEKVLSKFKQAYDDAVLTVYDQANVHVSISNANSKMGAVSSVSMLPFLTCPVRCKDSCGSKCYAAKLANLRPSVLKSYALNTALAIHAPDRYWQDVNEAIRAVRYFRFHVSGDILNMPYLERMIATAQANPHTEILAFTKRYELINTYLDRHGVLPTNLNILLSGWENLKPINTHNMPETNVIMRGAEPDPSWKICGGNCFNCACRGMGCWTARPGDVIAFHIH